SRRKVLLPTIGLPGGLLPMNSALFSRFPALTLAVLLSGCGLSLAGDVYSSPESGPAAIVLPKAGEMTELTAYPAKVNLKGTDDAAQLVVTGLLSSGRKQDLSGNVVYAVGDEKIVKITPSGRVLPVGNGTTSITAKFLDKVVTVPITVAAIGENLPINFGNQVVPVFTKLGCNSGGCHGKASGQNGFKLSLLGFEPEVDFTSLVKEARGRRLFPAAPERSLLLMKATGAIAHGGGKKMEPGSDEYKLVRRWIAAGMPFGKPTDPVVAKIIVVPDH